MTARKDVDWTTRDLHGRLISSVTGEDWQLYLGRTHHRNLHNDHIEVLREYFRDERDREFGLWRSPADPIFVGYKTRTGKVKLVNEVTGDHEIYSRRQAGQFPQSEFDVIAEEYFEAHPEKNPWHDAKPGEVWDLTTTHIPNKVTAWSTFDGVFMDSAQNWIIGMDILEARRIWPESKES